MPKKPTNNQLPAQIDPNQLLNIDQKPWDFRNGLKTNPITEAKKFWHTLGPGFTTGAADDDPAGIGTYSQAGAKYGLDFLWLAPYSFPLMAIVQEMCARIGLVTGRGLAGNIKRFYPKKFLYIVASLLFLANTFNIGANLGAMAEAVRLLAPSVNFSFLVMLFVIISLTMQIYLPYKAYSKYLKVLALILLAYIAASFFAHLDAGEVIKRGFLPSINFSSSSIFMLCAFLGTTISPYLFFWQTSQEVEEEIMDGKTTLRLRQSETAPSEIRQMRLDVWLGMFFSNLVAFFIVTTTAATLHQNGITNVNSAADAALALKPIAGNYAFLLFAGGIIGTGLLAVPILAGGASYALSEAFGWRAGLYRKLKQAKAFYGVIIASMVLGLLMNFSGINPIKTLIYSAIINGIVAPLVLAPIVAISSSQKIMGKQVNGKFVASLGWLITTVMIIVGVATLAALLFQ
ncbi:MAG: divalent metal cation transporter [Candidatus Doudnabacteria bacterium]|nr:divalent metal cation transporter [Candidatus Doudnabacteria bacterium]